MHYISTELMPSWNFPIPESMMESTRKIFIPTRYGRESCKVLQVQLNLKKLSEKVNLKDLGARPGEDL